jgi:tetratricopeptide (TPR) repeat protein
MDDDRERLRHLPVTTDSAEARHHFEVGRMMAFQYQQQRARRSLDEAIAADPGFVLAYLHRGGMSNGDEREPYFEQARANMERVTADEGRMVDAFHAFLWDQRVPDAVAIFTELADRYEDDPYLPTYLGLRYLHNLGRPDLAREQFERALSRDPGFAPGHLWLGQVALREDDLGEAERRFGRYLDLAPREPRAHDSLGILRQRQGRYDEAEASFNEALALEPDFTESREHLVGVAIQRSLHRLEEAVVDGDAAAIGDTYAAATRVSLPGSPPLEGAEAVSRYWTESPKRLTLETTEVFLGDDDDVATEVGRYRLGEDLRATGAHITIWAMTAKGWRIYRSVWTPD